jgi:hypothetical protein
MEWLGGICLTTVLDVRQAPEIHGSSTDIEFRSWLDGSLEGHQELRVPSELLGYVTTDCSNQFVALWC